MSAGPETVRVLHVDDDAEFAELTAAFLEREDERIEVSTATSAAEGLDRLAAGDEAIDCVVSDYEMPGMDGIEFLRAVRDRQPDLPFLLFTGKGDEAVASDAISAGVTDYLQKESGTGQYALLANRVINAVERRAAERELAETRERFRTLLADGADYVHVLDADGVVEYVTPSVERVLGYEPSDLEGGDAFENVHPEDRAAAVAQFEEVASDPGAEATLELRGAHADGSWRWLEVKSRNLLDDPVIGGVVGNVRDVTERRESEAAVDWHRTVLRNMGEGVYVFDADGVFRFVNYRVTELDGETEADWVGRHVSHLAEREVLSEAEVEWIERGIDRILDGDADEMQIEIEPAVPPSASVVELRLTPFRPDTGERLVLGTTRDVTEQVETRSELERQNERLEEFTSVVSHDLRNPLNVLAGSLDLAEETGDPEQFERCRRAVDRMRRLIDDLLTLARQGETAVEMAPVALADAAERCWRSVETGGADLVVEAEAVVEADESRLCRLLENLFHNAVEHGSTGSGTGAGDGVDDGSATAGTDGAAERGDADLTVTVGDLPDGFYVADDGAGVPAERRDRVFEPGYSTAESGTGFGLAIVTGIADAHGWEVSVGESDAGGARFEITAPEAGPEPRGVPGRVDGADSRPRDVD